MRKTDSIMFWRKRALMLWLAVSSYPGIMSDPVTTADTLHYDLLTVDATTQFIPVCDGPSLPNSQIIHQFDGNYSQGEIIEVTCHEGYRFPSSSPSIFIKCLKPGIWVDLMDDPALPNCELIGACPVPVIHHGSVAPSPTGNYMPRDIAPIHCNHGYTLSPSLERPFLKCQNDGTWVQLTGSDEIPTCQRHTCDNLPEIPHAAYQLLSTSSQQASDAYEGTKVYYYCNEGYHFLNNERVILECRGGSWLGHTQACTKTIVSSWECPTPPSIAHGYYTIFHSSSINQIQAMYYCEQGYKKMGNTTIICQNGQWLGETPTCITLSKGCLPPPVIAHGVYNFIGESGADAVGRVSEGVHVYYTCESGYKMGSSNISVLTCFDSQWAGENPQCVKRTNCDPPMEIPHGTWHLKSLHPHNDIGAQISYKCDDGYRSLGVTRLECLDNGYWSDYAPRCLHTEKYCPDPGPLEHGYYMCSPNHCNLFSIGTEVHYMCKRNYMVAGTGSSVMIACIAGGVWSQDTPVCLPEAAMTGGFFNASTLTVVVSTSCGVLGVLVVIMLLVVFKQRRLGGRLRLSTPASPPPTPPHPGYALPPREDLMNDEHDRVALIAFANGVSVMLPSYEEAVRGRHHYTGPRLARFNSDTSSMTSSTRSSSRGEYRPLPSLPPNLRRPTSRDEHHDLHRDPYHDHHRDPYHDPHDHHRNSIITTASIATRDNLSLAFGSMDTMNASDNTSTSVTVDTYDSMASNPSLALSQRAAAGSILSSSTHSNLTNEGAPLRTDHSVSPAPILHVPGGSSEISDSTTDIGGKED